jgi:hypothetical protein
LKAKGECTREKGERNLSRHANEKGEEEEEEEEARHETAWLDGMDWMACWLDCSCLIRKRPFPFNKTHTSARTHIT